MTMHYRRDHPFMPYDIQECERLLQRMKDLGQEISVRPFKCSICNLSFSNNKSCRFHVSTHSREENRCPKCSKICKNPSAVQECLEKHGELRLPCDIKGCQYVAFTRSGLRYHQKNSKSHNRPKIKCDNCQWKFYTSSGLKLHQKKPCKEHPRTYFCLVCNKQYYSWKRCQRHQEGVNKCQRNLKLPDVSFFLFLIK